LKRLQTQLARFDVPRTNRARIVPDVGFQFDVEGSWFPKVLDVEEDFTTLEAKMSGYYVIGKKRKVVLYGGVGGRKVWGRFPWREAAYVGGQRSNRGFETNRFAGHSSLYGRAELQWHLFDALFFIPGRFWIYGLADAGRVWFDDEDSDDWHPSYGGGIALDLPASPLRFRLELAQNTDEGELQFYFATGFSF
jgi:outer membrane protein assembly factor BamA